MTKTKIKLFIILVFLFFPLLNLQAAFFNPDKVISDDEYTNYKSLNKKQIQNFLANKKSGLAKLKTNGKSIALIFYEAAQKYKINPKLLIATAQKEQSAVTDSALTEYQKKYLMGYAVYPGSPYLDKYSGIYKQITNSAWQFNKYMELYWRFKFQKGKRRTTSDGYSVKPFNKATAGLYNYTPHAGAGRGSTIDDSGNGNFLFWQIWQNWFAVVYPNGTLIKIEGDDLIYILKNGFKRPFLSERVLQQRKYNKNKAVVISADQDNYFKGTATIFPNGLLLKDKKKNFFIVSKKRLRRFKSVKKFKRLGYKKRKALFIDENGKRFYKKGKLITKNTQLHPDGTVIFNKKTKQKYLIKGGYKKPIVSHVIYKNQFSSRNRAFVSKKVIKSYPTGDPVLLRSGTIIKGGKKLFIIEDGTKRPISRSTFEDMGYKYEAVLDTPYKVRKLHEKGEKIKL